MAKRSPMVVTAAQQPKRSRATATPPLVPSSALLSPPRMATTTTTDVTDHREADSRREWQLDAHLTDESESHHRSPQPQHDNDDLAALHMVKQQSLHAAPAVDESADSRNSTTTTRTRAPSIHTDSADRHSCLAAPYSPSDARTVRYFDVAISQAKAPVTCASAGKLKGKAIFSDCALEPASRIWSEAPFVAMQHEANRRDIQSCQNCFVPLVTDYQTQWRDMVLRYNTSQVGTDGYVTVPDDAFDVALNQLDVNRRVCGLAEPGALCQCQCGAVYCSKLCQLTAFHDFHAILCPRTDAFGAMSTFLRHVQLTNDIFFLAAKVVAKLVSRYIRARDVLKAREPMDMFYKKPWWEVVLLEKQLATTTTTRDDGVSTSTRDDATVETIAQACQDGQYPRDATSIRPPSTKATATDSVGLSAHLDEMQHATADAELEAQCLRELLTTTHELLLDAIESNLVHLARDDQLQGLSVDALWSACASILSFEFFAAQLGLFEMNNVRMEIDHPFRALMEILDPDVDAPADSDGPTNPDTVSNDRVAMGPNTVSSDSDSAAQVRRVLEFEDARLSAEQLAKSDDGPTGPTLSDSAAPTGFQGVEGTALFPIICTMNHSCEPNCTVLYTEDSRAHVVAVRPIAKGDELCICYIDVDDDVKTREANLREYQFKCFCARCSAERRALTLSPASGERSGRVAASTDA